MSKDEKQARLEKMIREQLDEKNFDQQTPGAPNTPTYHSSTSLRSEQGNGKERSRPSSAMKPNQS